MTRLEDRAFIERYFHSLYEIAGLDLDGLRAWEVDDIHGSFPWGGQPDFRNIEEHHALLAMLPQRLTRYEVTIDRISPLADAGVYVVEGTSGGPLQDGSGDIETGIVSFLTVRDGRLAGVREYFRRLRAPGR